MWTDRRRLRPTGSRSDAQHLPRCAPTRPGRIFITPKVQVSRHYHLATQQAKLRTNLALEILFKLLALALFERGRVDERFDRISADKVR